MRALTGLDSRLMATWVVLALLLAGCGGGATDSSDSSSPGSTTASNPPPMPPSASLGQASEESTPAPAGPSAQIAEIARLKSLPETVVEIRYENGKRIEENRRAATPEEIAAEQQKRLNRIVELAEQVIKETNANPEEEQIFNNAVHYLADARLQLAAQGSAEQAQLLADDAEALFGWDSSSFAAVESGHKVVQLAELMAARYGAQNRDWVAEYAHQAQTFASRFPQEQGRSAVSLIAAGRKCEQYGLTDEARNCFLQVEKQYSGSVFATQIAGILRRLRLEGQPLELAGDTIDGGFFSAEKFAGSPLLVVFWASGSETFRRDMTVLKQLSDTYKEPQLTIVGVCLDQNEAAVDTFLEEYGVSWRQIFFADPNQRGGRNPVARYYGVHLTPTYWLVDAKGIVAAAPVAIAELPGRVEQLVKAAPPRAESKKVTPVSGEQRLPVITPQRGRPAISE